MYKMTEKEIDGKIIRSYKAQGEDLPVIYMNDYGESGDAVLKKCRELSCPQFDLVTISNIGWDEELTPWKSDPVVTRNDNFCGGGSAYLQWISNCVVSFAQKTLNTNGPAYIAGYSLAGLFALWSLYATDVFRGAVCASGSLWYPGFLDFILSNELKNKPEGIYLSLGDRESAAKNPVLQKTGSIYKEIEEHYRRKGITSVFEVNRGNHYVDAELRTAKGIDWLLRQRGRKTGEGET